MPGTLRWVLPLLLVAAAAQPQSPEKRDQPLVLVTPNQAWLLGPPAPTIRAREAYWHPKRSLLLVIQRSVRSLSAIDALSTEKLAEAERAAPAALFLYDPANGQSRQLASIKEEFYWQGTGWIAGGYGVMVQAGGGDDGKAGPSLTIIHTASGKSMPYPGIQSPLSRIEHPFGFFREAGKGVEFVDLRGPQPVVRPAQLPKRDPDAPVYSVWQFDENGKVLEETKPRSGMFFLIDPLTGEKSGPVPLEPDQYSPWREREGTLRMIDRAAAIEIIAPDIRHTPTSGKPQHLPVAPGLMPLSDPWARAVYRNPIPVAAEGKSIGLSDSEDYAAYIIQGVLFVRTVQPVDLLAAFNRRMDDLKAEVMQNAKQAGTATMLYAADYDDALPTGINVAEVLGPYLRNSGILNQVVWTNINGQKVTSFNSPMDIVLGYIIGPGGRAEIRGDSSVRWIPNPRP